MRKKYISFLNIRKTYQTNHAKLYLFKLEQSQVGRKSVYMFITGSSNLTKTGISSRLLFTPDLFQMCCIQALMFKHTHTSDSNNAEPSHSHQQPIHHFPLSRNLR